VSVKKLFLTCAAVTSILVQSVHPGQVIAWVAPYSVAASQTMLQKDFGGVGMKDGLSYLALQFWITNGPGLSKDGNISSTNFDSDVTWFRDWGHKYGIIVELCVDNYVGGWSWPAAVSSFGTNRSAFVKSLVAEVNRLGLDGADLDFEGTITLSTADRDAYYAFAAELSDSMHAHGKHVTVASFAAQWNAPNWDMWPTLFLKVDGVTSMGYDQSGLATDYAAQRQHASSAPEKFMIGMPGYSGSWLGNTVVQQVDWVVADGKVGVGIWDATLTATAWQTADVWNRLKTIRLETATPAIAHIPEIGNDRHNLQISGNQLSGIDVTLSSPAKGDAFLKIFNSQGRLIARIRGVSDDNRSVSFHWSTSANSAPTGFYAASVELNGKDFVHRLMVLH
jgi:Glycosyl hydrolases family 18